MNNGKIITIEKFLEIFKEGKDIEEITNEYSSYTFVLKRNGTNKKCSKCNNKLGLYFSDQETEYHYECSNCGWISEIKRNYESKYAKEMGLYKKRNEEL